MTGDQSRGPPIPIATTVLLRNEGHSGPVEAVEPFEASGVTRMTATQTLNPIEKMPSIALHGVDYVDAKINYFHPITTSASVARRETFRLLRKWSIEDFTDQAELIVSELVTNAIRATREIQGTPSGDASDATRGSIQLTLTLISECFFISVSDGSPKSPQKCDLAPESVNGRGLLLVESMCNEWGFYFRQDRGKVVWAELNSR